MSNRTITDGINGRNNYSIPETKKQIITIDSSKSKTQLLSTLQ